MIIDIEAIGPKETIYTFEEMLRIPGVYQANEQSELRRIIISIGEKQFLVMDETLERPILFSYNSNGGWGKHKFIRSNAVVTIKN